MLQKRKKRCLSLKTFALAILMVLFAMPVKAQNVYMHTGTMTVPSSGSVNFYDSGGESHGPDYYWERWFQRNEEFTFTFSPAETGKKIKVTFNEFTAYLDNGGYNHAIGNEWSMRLNTAELSVYDGDAVDDANLITTYTGNMTGAFSVIANGPITFYFHSYGYREEGWQASVQCVDDYELQKPQISFEACSDAIVINANNKGAEIYYLLDQEPDTSDPLQGAVLYEGPFSVNAGTTIYACAKLGNQNSAYASKEFTSNDVTPTPGVPTITREMNTITMTPAQISEDINETYYVWYTTDGTEPTTTNGQRYTAPFEWHTPYTVFKAVTRASSCSDKMSTVVEFPFDDVKVPTPTITFPDGNATIACTMSGVTIYYTIDGSTPTTSSTAYTAPFAVSYGTTVKAIAVMGQAGFENSEVASNIYVPEGGSGIGGGVVILDDREDHSWSYYSDGDQPVHSLNPADVKITYFGFGENTMTTTDTGDTPTTFDGDVTSSQVAVGPNDSGNQFIYLKTLEAANEDGTGNYPYTLIPNPFSKRPTGESTTVTPPTRTVYISGRSRGNGSIQVEYKDANNVDQTWSNNSGQNVTDDITVKTGTTITLRAIGRSNNGNNYSTITARYDDANGQQIATVTANASNYTTGATATGNVTAPSTTVPGWRGFYAWRVKRLSGATIEGYGVGDIIPAETEIKFVAEPNSTDNEVEFEALWAQAYVVTSNTATGLHSGVSYERNFVVTTSAITATLNVPVTYSTYNPDGTGGSTSTVTLNGSTLNSDTKFEYMNLTGGNTVTANNHYLCFGRGISTNQSAAGTVQGINAGATDLNYTIRIESGTFGRLAFVRSGTNTTVSGRVQVKAIMGCDYDRANKDNTLLSVSNQNDLFFSSQVSYSGAGNKDQKTFDCVVKSGEYQRSYWTGNNNNGAYNHSFYCGPNQGTNNYPGVRYVTVEGGEFSSMNGGRGVSVTTENGGTTYATPDVIAFDLRIKNGTFHGSVFGGAADNPSIGSRRIVITGGDILGWVAAGANGTGSVGSSHAGTDGNSFVYVGGTSTIGSTNPPTINETEGGNVFGAGRGRENQKGSMVNSNVVVADNTTIFQNVYGAGYNGYIENTSNVYVLGGTVKLNVFGGGFNHSGSYNNVPKDIPTSNVYVNGGKVEGSVYGGSNSSGNVINSHVTVTDVEQVTNVFGGGYGESTNIGTTANPGSASVSVSGGTISNNVYGGGEEGKVNGNTNVTVSGGKVKDVYGAGKGSDNSTAQVTGSTTVQISGGEVVNVYGGGQAGDVVNGTNLASTVTVSGGNVAGDVFGGGRMGKTTGNTEVDVKGGTIRGNVFGGAYGESNQVFVAGKHSVNIMGGRIFKNVYGGSRNANDALAFTGYNTTETAMSSVVNISAGQVDEQVYAAGYFGQTFGSVYVFVGKEAILHAPNCAPSFGSENENMYKTGKLLLAYSVWAGSDFGTFSGGTFTAPNISGYSDIYVDGEGYDTQTADESAPSYMNIKGSLLGCGTSGDAGTQGRGIYVRNYGHVNGGSKNDNFPEPFSDATRSFFSIQRADTLVIDNSHINFTGQAKINSLDATEKYAIYSFDKTVRMTSGSSLFLNAPVFQIIDFWSATVDDLYNGINAVYTPIAYNGLGATGGPIDNKIRVNGGNYIEIYHDQMTYENGTVAAGYGMLNGFAHMMVAESNADNTCAYARPKQCDATPIDGSLDNPNDGGWVSYDSEKNIFDIDGYTVSAGSSDQMPYENHTTNSKAGEQYFRIWRVGGMYSEREGVINAYADGTESFNYVDVTIKLPAWRSGSAYYKFETSGSGANLNTTIDYGPDVMTYATAIASETSGTQNWIHFVENPESQEEGADVNAQNQINSNPNVNFGLVTLAGDGMTLVSPVSSQGGLIVCPESDQFLASVDNNGTVNRFNCSDNTVEPQVTFRLTYSNQISTNMTWDPMFVTLVQCDENGNITDIVKISLTINTYTTINNVFTTQTYAMMDGRHGTAEYYTAKVILPTFTLHDYTAANLSQFTLTNVTFEPNNVDATEQDDCWRSRGSAYDMKHFAMEIAASRNADNSDGWNGTATGTYDSHNYTPNVLLGETSARTPFAFDFTLWYNGNNGGVAFTENEQQPALLGVLTFTIRFTNYANGNPNDDYSQNLTIKVQVIRRGVGKVFYLDGQNGSNANSALYPNDAALSLSYIFNRCGYLPGDIIYIVNTVDVNKNLEWSGSAYNGVTIYRYPGGHPLVSKQQTDINGDPLYWTDETQTETTTTQTDYPVWYTPLIVDNENNEAFTGTLVDVQGKGNLIIRDITLDGHMTDNPSPYSTTQNPLTDAGVTSASPMITVASGGTVTLTNGSMLQHNNSTANGGAMAVDDGGTLMMNHNASIMNNVTSGQGGAVYMAGTMIVSDAVQLINNTSGTTPNNVYLTAPDVVIQIGTSNASDEFGELSTDARIGVTKPLFGNVDGYTEVVKVETTNEIPWLADPFVRPNTIIFHDGHKYELEEYNDPTYLYWIGTWVTVQDWNPEYESADAPGYDPNNFGGHLNNIDTPEELAWLISYVNGYNGAQPHQNAVATITADIDMNASIWVPIGNTNTPYTGTFEGNGHVISGVHSILVNDNAAMFGVTQNATIQNVEAVVYFDGNSINKGTFIGTMTGGTLANVEAAGALIGKANTINMGGLVGLANGTLANKSLIHSGFSVNTITAEKATTVVGGLVGSLGDAVTDENDVTTKYYGDLYNSYANVTLGSGNVATTVGGLVGINHEGCTVENCYVVNPINPSAVFAYTNKGTIDICYAESGTTSFVGPASTNLDPTKHGTYAAVLGRKDLGYMYDDNEVTLIGSGNIYVTAEDTIYYDGAKIEKWRGLLSCLNQWVKANPKNLVEPAPWFRPTTGDINGDLPLLGFHKDNSLSTAVYNEFNEGSYNYLHYGAFDATNNGLDRLLTLNAGKSAYMFLYGNATKVVGETGSNQLFINEDAVLIQDPIASSKDGEPQYKTINATVGITFDNSCRHAFDYWGNKLTYDWHMMATPLSNAKMGTKYDEYETNMAHSNPAINWGDVKELNDSYFPNGLMDTTVKWDFYSYFEPQYHWINYKRDKKNHFHYDEINHVHANIVYTGTDQGLDDEESATCVFTPGKGYMMAISQDSYMSSTGTLNNGSNGGVKIDLTNQEPDTIGYSKGWNLIGNPYQAYFDLSQVDNGSFSFYIYDADQDVYAPVTNGQSENPCIPSLYIHPHQAFFMYYNPDSGENDTVKEFTFDYGLATATKETGSYYRGREGQVNYPLVNLFAENERGNHDLTIIELHRPELGGATKVSAMCNANFQIAASFDGKRYGILFTPEGTERVPVNFKTEESGVFTLRWSTHNGDFTSLRLVDNKTGVNYDMLTNDHYTFEASADDYASRFYITYTCTGVDEEVMFESDNFAFFDGNEWIINGKGHLDVVDMTGRVLYAEQLNNEQNRVNLDGYAKGVYLLRVIDNKVVRTQKIIVR